MKISDMRGTLDVPTGETPRMPAATYLTEHGEQSARWARLVMFNGEKMRPDTYVMVWPDVQPHCTK